MQLEKIQKIAFISTIVSSILFLILTTIGMFVYAGGSHHIPEAKGYDFLENFFSDLGRVVVFDGATNTFSRILFVTALTLVGLSLGLYSFVIVPLFSETKGKKVLSILGSISGVISALNLILLGIVSLDMHEFTHGTFVVIAFIATAIALIFFSIIIFTTKDFPNFYAWVIAFCTVASITYVVIMFGWEFIEIFSGWTVQTVSQKVIVYIQIITLAILAIGTLQFFNRKTAGANTDELEQVS